VNGFSSAKLLAALSGITVALVLGGCGSSGGDSAATPPLSAVVAPLTLPGPYAVACSNVEQDFSRLAPGEEAADYWDGVPSASGAPRYAADLLADPANTLSVTVTPPSDANLYGSTAGTQVSYIVLACYPTDGANPRADYPLPTGSVVPHMQIGAEQPLFADAAAHYPVIAFSHGYGGSPIASQYLSVVSMLASYGYIVVAPFHGDQRFSDLAIDSFADAVALVAHLGPFTVLQALRPRSMSATLDLILAHPQWRDHIDAAQIGGFGASLGGETLMLMGGAGLTTSIGLSSTQVMVDPRLKAAVGYVPYFGQPFLPAFGRDGQGLDRVTLPYLAISGTADKTAPIAVTAQGMNRLAGTRELVSLAGVTHEFDVASTNDIYTWTLTFLDAQVRGNPVALKQLATMASVAGGGDDKVVIPIR